MGLIVDPTCHNKCVEKRSETLISSTNVFLMET
jgi:hypothetical protein